jgi:hypothetical protein
MCSRIPSLMILPHPSLPRLTTFPPPLILPYPYFWLILPLPPLHKQYWSIVALGPGRSAVAVVCHSVSLLLVSYHQGPGLTFLKCWFFLSPSLPGWQHQLSNVVTSPFLCISPPHSLIVHLLVDSKGCCDVISSCSVGSIPGESISVLPLLSYTSFERQTRSVWHIFTSNLSFLRKAL